MSREELRVKVVEALRAAADGSPVAVTRMIDVLGLVLEYLSDFPDEPKPMPSSLPWTTRNP